MESVEQREGLRTIPLIYIYIYVYVLSSEHLTGDGISLFGLISIIHVVSSLLPRLMALRR